MAFCFVLQIKCLFKVSNQKKKTYLFLPFDYNSLYIYQFLYPSLHRLQTKGKRETRKKETKNIKAFCLKRENTNTHSTQFSLSLSLCDSDNICLWLAETEKKLWHSQTHHHPLLQSQCQTHLMLSSVSLARTSGRVSSPGQSSSTSAMSSFATRTPRFGPPKSRPPNSIRFPGCSLLLSKLGRLIWTKRYVSVTVVFSFMLVKVGFGIL